MHNNCRVNKESGSSIIALALTEKNLKLYSCGHTTINVYNINYSEHPTTL